MLINQPFMEMLELRYIGVVLVFYQFLKEFAGILSTNNRCINNLYIYCYRFIYTFFNCKCNGIKYLRRNR